MLYGNNKEGRRAGKYRVEIHGFDYDNAKTKVIESEGSENIVISQRRRTGGHITTYRVSYPGKTDG